MTDPSRADDVVAEARAALTSTSGADARLLGAVHDGLLSVADTGPAAAPRHDTFPDLAVRRRDSA